LLDICRSAPSRIGSKIIHFWYTNRQRDSRLREHNILD
jgi:hypothetical protein